MAKRQVIKPLSNGLGIDLAIEAASLHKNRLARRLLWLNLACYVLLSGTELAIGYWTQAAALLADGQNNLTGILSATLLLVGLHYAKLPRDTFHLEGHWQYEVLAVFLSGLLMVLVGLSCIWSASWQTWQVLSAGRESLNLLASLTAGFSGGLLVIEALINAYQGRRLQDSALLASARDYFSDAITSGVTMVAITLAWLTHWYLIDTLTALGLGAYICWNGGQILSQSATKLSNGFAPSKQQQIVVLLAQHPAIQRVIYVNGRYVGDNLVLDIAVVVAPELTVQATDQLRVQLEAQLAHQWSILYCCVEFRAS